MIRRRNNQALIIFFSIVTVFLLYMLAPILTPFLLGALLAYLANPLVKYLVRKKMPHLLAVILVFFAMFGSIVLLFVILIPVIEEQIVALIDMIPDIISWLQQEALPWLQQFVNIATIKSSLSTGISKSLATVSTLLASGYTLIGWIINIVLTPVVTFYLLRDWDIVTERCKKLIPKSKETSTLKLLHQCDEVLSVFFRGQFLVMLSVSLIYSVGLTVIGLKTGLIIGLIGGILSIIPFLGSTFVLITASLASLVQFTTLKALYLVFLVFLIGQALEGYVLTPYLVGGRIGLHPVVVIFAVMAGGTLFGFFGVLLALPVAAVSKVLLGFINDRYELVRT